MSTKTLQEHFEDVLQLEEEGDIGKAHATLEWLIAASPNEPILRFKQSNLAAQLARPFAKYREDSIFQAVQYTQLVPENPQGWVLLGEANACTNQFSEAIAAYEKAVQLDPDNAMSWTHLGFCYTRLANRKEAIRCYNKAIELDPELGEAHFLLSTEFYGELHNSAKLAYHAEKGFQAAKPSNNSTEACWNAALGYLGSGDYAKGWNYFEARLKRNATNKHHMLPQERYAQPLWVRQENCTVLVQHEMGLGDMFFFARFLRAFKKKYNAEIILEVKPEMHALLRYNFGHEMKVIQWGCGKAETFDYQLPMMSLPLAMACVEPYYPGPYIQAEPWKIAEWDEWLIKNVPESNLKVGLCWKGGRRNHSANNYETDLRRSLDITQVAHFLNIPNVPKLSYISLQVGDKNIPVPDNLKDWSDTAGIIENLDAVVSVDTAVANLAGAMGKRVFLLNRYDNCWRWVPGKEQPWYPSITSYRQTQSGVWGSVISDIITDLTHYAA